jgi:hypothetical protein
VASSSSILIDMLAGVGGWWWWDVQSLAGCDAVCGQLQIGKWKKEGQVRRPLDGRVDVSHATRA